MGGVEDEVGEAGGVVALGVNIVEHGCSFDRRHFEALEELIAYNG